MASRRPLTRRRASPKAVAKPRAARATSPRTLERRLARLEKDLAEAERRHARELAAVRRAADRRVTGMMREIATLRHHEARAQALARLLAERDAALAAAPSSAGVDEEQTAS